jgi:hypothetical protein
MAALELLPAAGPWPKLGSPVIAAAATTIARIPADIKSRVRLRIVRLLCSFAAV